MAHCFLIGSERNLLKWLQENTGQFMMFNKRRRWFQSSRVKFPLVNMSASWVFGVNIFDLDLGVQVDSVKHPSSRNSVGCRLVSHHRTSALNGHVDHSFVIFKNVQLRLTLRRVCVCGNMVHMRQLINVSVSLLFGFGCAISFGITQTVTCCGLGFW